MPIHGWNTVFLHGHGFWTSLENVVVGPFIAIISFVCSVGNVPLAAALWHGGISFGGVISFIFADLIAFPLLLIYRRYYGTRLTLRMLAIFWAVMATAGLITEGIFRVAGLVPKTRPAQIVPSHFSWNYTSYLNIIFLALFGLLYWTYRNRARLGGGGGYALDPVCGMQVETSNAPASTVHQGERVYFCSDRCRLRFEGDPGRFERKMTKIEGMDMPTASVVVERGSSEDDIDPVCGMTVDRTTAASRHHAGEDYYFCCIGCAESFEANPEGFLIQELTPKGHLTPPQ